MQSQIRYLAIVSESPNVLASFYSTYFAMRELGRSETGEIALTDGFYNISILKPRDGASELGISHFGITIDNIASVEARLKEFAPNAEIREEEGGLFHGDYRVTDPYGQVVSLSTHDFHTPSVKRAFPCIRHLAMCVTNNDEVLDFYVNVFGFRESTTSKRIRAENRVVRWTADGETAMAILPDRHAPRHERKRKPEGWTQSLWLARHRHRAFSGQFAGRLYQQAALEQADGRVSRLRSG